MNAAAPLGLALFAAAIAAAGPGAGVRAGSGATPGREDKNVPVVLQPFRYKVAAPPPATWNAPTFNDQSWSGPSAGPFVPRQPAFLNPSPAGALFDAIRGAPLLLRGRFSVADPSHVAVLELDVAYADGFVAYVNGREVARRGMPGGAADGAPPAPHGPEVERVFVPASVFGALNRDANVLALAVYGYPGRSAIVPPAPAVSVGVTAARGVRLVRGPYLMAPEEGKRRAAVSVAWETDLPASGRVLVWPADAPAGAAPTSTVTTAALTARQVVHLTGLDRGARYRYLVEARADDRGASGPRDDTGAAVARSEAAVFETVPSPSAPFRFAVYGDMRYPGHEAHRAVVEALVREKPALVLNTGDLTDVGSEESNWQRYFDITAPLGAIAPVVPALGNHDAARRGIGEPIAWKLFGVPAHAPPGWGSFELAGVHFVILDTNEMRDPAQLAWLAADLAAADRRRPRAVLAFCHEPPWSHGLHGSSSFMIRHYAPLLAAGGVDLLFAGHDHIYERGAVETSGGKLSYIVTGGGGAPLYEPRCKATSGPPPGVAEPLPPCPASVAALTKAYHYLMVDVSERAIRICPRRPDGSPLEPCTELPAHTPAPARHAGP